MPLLRADRLNLFASEIALGVSRFAVNSAQSLLALQHLVCHRFIEGDIESLLARIEAHLDSDDFAEKVGQPVEAPDSVAMTRFEHAWFCYYYARLPLLLRQNRPIGDQGALRIDRAEVHQIAVTTGRNWGNRLNDLQVITRIPVQDFERMSTLIGNGYALSRWWIARKRWEHWQYDSEWLWEPFQAVLSPIAKNPRKVTDMIIEQSFPLFWNAHVEWYRRLCRHSSLHGIMQGTLDTSEWSNTMKKDVPSA